MIEDVIHLQAQHTGTMKKVLQYHLKPEASLFVEHVSDGLETVMKHRTVLFEPG